MVVVMPSKEYASLEKLFDPSLRPVAHSSIKDGNLQIQIPIPLKINNFDEENRFKALHTRLERASVIHNDHKENMEPNANPVLAMEDAQNMYETMMEIHTQLNQAYEEFMRLQ
jgi:hypothetical protein